jgi:hypothetical protein
MWPWNDPSKKYESDAYEKVSKELLNNQLDTGLWAKIFSDTKGDTSKATARYIKERAGGLAWGMHTQAVHDEEVAAKKASDDAAVLWGCLFVVALCAFAGWWIFDHTASVPLGIAYFVCLVALPSMWLGGAIFATAYTISVLLSASLLAFAHIKFSVNLGQPFFWSGIAANAVIFIGCLWLRKRIFG